MVASKGNKYYTLLTIFRKEIEKHLLLSRKRLKNVRHLLFKKLFKSRINFDKIFLSLILIHSISE